MKKKKKKKNIHRELLVKINIKISGKSYESIGKESNHTFMAVHKAGN